MTLFDPGLQPERTELAWRRTALALGIGSLVALRLLPAVFAEPRWALAGIVGVIAATAIWIGARRRFRAVNVILAREGDRAVLPDGRMLGAFAVFVFIGGLAALAVVLLAALT